MITRHKKSSGFTIVELLIVIIVIGILAAITIVAFNGVRRSAAVSVLTTDLRNASNSALGNFTTTGTYPATSSGLPRSGGTEYEYTNNGSSFCLTASSNAAQTSFYFDSAESEILEGACPGHDGYTTPTDAAALYDVGNYHGCVYDTAMYCWGLNYGGQLGNGVVNLLNTLTPVAVDTTTGLAGKTITDVDLGEDGTCVIADGQPYCWGEAGYDYYGVTGITTGDVSRPYPIDTSGVLAGKTLTQIAAGNSHFCAIDTDGVAYCWGSGTSGQLGNGLSTSSRSPVIVDRTGAINNQPITQIEAGGSNTCAIAGGRAYCWGLNSNGGQAGDGTFINRSTPVAVDTTTGLGTKTVTDISASSYFSVCAVADGEVYCWGYDCCGNHGNTDGSPLNADYPTPRPVNMTGVMSGLTATDVSSGYVHSCALADGRAFCWGAGNSGTLGYNSTVSSTAPVAVVNTGVLQDLTLRSIKAGENFTCTDSNLNIYCWGNGSRIGYGSTTNSLVPVPVIGFGG